MADRERRRERERKLLLLTLCIFNINVIKAASRASLRGGGRQEEPGEREAGGWGARLNQRRASDSIEVM